MGLDSCRFAFAKSFSFLTDRTFMCSAAYHVDVEVEVEFMFRSEVNISKCSTEKLRKPSVAQVVNVKAVGCQQGVEVKSCR